MLQLQFLNTSKPPVWLVEANYIIGSSAKANCVLALPGLLPEHAKLVVAEESVYLVPYSDAAYSAVNGHLVRGRIALHHGDTLTLGSAQIAVVDPKIVRKVETPVEEPPAWRLQATSVALAQREYILQGTMVLGRSRDCDICLALAHLSRRHAKFTVTAQGLELEDLGSSNGSFVNGKKVKRVQLKNGDEVSFDSLKFKVIGLEEDTDKTSIRPALTADFLATQVVQRPTSEPLKPSPKLTASAKTPATVTPVGRRKESNNGMPLVIVGAMGLVLVFGGVVWFLLQ